MFAKIIDQISKDIAKKKDVWFLQTMEKHNLIQSDNLSNFNLYWLREEMGVRLIDTKDKITQIFIRDILIGEWDNNCECIKTDDDKYIIKTNSWN